LRITNTKTIRHGGPEAKGLYKLQMERDSLKWK